MPNRFLRELDQWIIGLLRQKLSTPETNDTVPQVTAADLATMLADYVLFTIAESPVSCWTACELDFLTDEEIMTATTFTEEMFAAAFIGAVCELNGWDDNDGVAFMIKHGVAGDDAREIAAALEVVSEKIGFRGQALVQRLAAPHSRR